MHTVLHSYKTQYTPSDLQSACKISYFNVNILTKAIFINGSVMVVFFKYSPGTKLKKTVWIKKLLYNYTSWRENIFMCYVSV